MHRRFAKGLAAILLGGVGGYLFWLLNLPLPWMMGAMMAAALASVAGFQIVPLNPLRPLMLAIVGTMLGSSFSVNFFLDLQDLIIPLIGLLFASASGAFIAFMALRRFSNLSPETAYFAAMPGGVVEMVTLADENNADARTVALMHASRIFLVVLCLPFAFEWMTGIPAGRGSGAMFTLADMTAVDAAWFFGVIAAGFALGQVVHLPIRFMLAPMIVSMLVHVLGWTDFKIPFEILAVSQVVLGIGIGARFAGVDRRLVFRSLGLSFVVTAILIGAAILTALGIAQLTGMAPESLILSYAPGGLAEMGIIALALNLDVALVSANHLVRVLLVIVVAAVLFRQAKSRGWFAP